MINLSAKEIHDYCIGVEKRGEYDFVFDGDNEQFAGTNHNNHPDIFTTQKSTNFALFSHEICFSRLAPYQVLIIKRQLQ